MLIDFQNLWKLWAIKSLVVLFFLPSVLSHCWLGGRKGIRPVKTEWWGAGTVICLERVAGLHVPADASATHCLLLQQNPDWFYLSGTSLPG